MSEAGDAGPTRLVGALHRGSPTWPERGSARATKAWVPVLASRLI